jgi:hypothetical protein
VRADRARDFEHQRRVLLLETLYDAALTLPAADCEQKVADEVLTRAVAVLDAARGFLAIQGEGGGIASRSLVGFSPRNADKRILEEPFLREVEKAGSAVARGRMTLLRTPVANAVGVAIGSEGGSFGWRGRGVVRSRRRGLLVVDRGARERGDRAAAPRVAPRDRAPPSRGGESPPAG